MSPKRSKESKNINIKDIIYYGLILTLMVLFGSYCLSKAEIDLSQVAEQAGDMVCEMDTKLPSPEQSLWYGPDGKHLPDQDGVPSPTETCKKPLLDNNFSSLDWNGSVWTGCVHTAFEWGAYARIDVGAGKGRVLWPAPSALPIVGTAAWIPGPDGLLGVVYKTQTAIPSKLAVGVLGQDGWHAPPTPILKGQQSLYLGGAWVDGALEIIVVPDGQEPSPVQVRKTDHDHTEKTSALTLPKKPKEEEVYRLWNALYLDASWSLFGFGFKDQKNQPVQLYSLDFDGNLVKAFDSVERPPHDVIYCSVSGSVTEPASASLDRSQKLPKLYQLNQDGDVVDAIEIPFFGRKNNSSSYVLSGKDTHFNVRDGRIALKRMWTWYPRRTGAAERFIREVDGLWITTHLDPKKNQLMVSSEALFFEPVPVAQVPKALDCAGLADGALVPQGEASLYWLISPGGCRVSLDLAPLGL